MRFFWIFLVVGLIGLTSLQLWMTKDQSLGSHDGSVVTDSQVQIGGDFTLQDQNGQLVRSTDLRGKVLLVFFGFTHCPDICPTTVSTLSKVMDTLGDDAAKVVPVFITVDPQRDTSEVLKDYLSSFHKGMVGLTGPEDDIQKVLEAYKAYAGKVPSEATESHEAHEGHDDEEEDGKEEADYRMDHSSYVYLMNAEGGFEKLFAYNAPEAEVTQAVRALLK